MAPPPVATTARSLSSLLIGLSFVAAACGKTTSGTGEGPEQPVAARQSALSQPLVINKGAYRGGICIEGVGCEATYTHINDGVHNLLAPYSWGTDGTAVIGTIEVSGGEIVRVTSAHLQPVSAPVTTLTVISVTMTYQPSGTKNTLTVWGQDTIHPSAPQLALLPGRRYGVATNLAYNPATNSQWLTADGQPGPNVQVDASGAVSAIDGSHFASFFATTANGFAARAATVNYRANGVKNTIAFYGMDTIHPSAPSLALIGGLHYGMATNYAWNPATNSQWLSADGQPGPSVLVQLTGAVSGLEGSHFSTFFDTTADGFAAKATAVHYRTDGVKNPIHFWGMDTVSPADPQITLIGGLRYGFYTMYAFNPATGSQWLTADGQPGPTVFVQTTGAVSGVDGSYFSSFFDSTSNGLAAKETTVHYRPDGVRNPIHFWGMDTVSPADPQITVIGGMRYGFYTMYAFNPATGSQWLTADGQVGPTVLVQTTGAVSGVEGSYFSSFFDSTSNGLAAKETTVHYRPDGVRNPIHFWGMDTVHPADPQITVIGGMRYGFYTMYAFNPATNSQWLTADGQVGPTVLVQPSGAVSGLDGSYFSSFFDSTSNGLAAKETTVHYRPDGVRNPIHFWGMDTVHPSQPQITVIGGMRYGFYTVYAFNPATNSQWLTADGQVGPTVLVQPSGAVSGLDGSYFSTFFDSTSNGLAAKETTVHYRPDGVINPVHFWGMDTIHPSQPQLTLIGGMRYGFYTQYAWNPATNSQWLTPTGEVGPTVLVQSSGAVSGVDGSYFGNFFESTANGFAARETTVHYQPNGTPNLINFWGLDTIGPSTPRLTVIAGMRYAIATLYAQNPGTSSQYLTADGAPGPVLLVTATGAAHPLPGTPAATHFAATPDGFQPRRTLRVGYDPAGAAVNLLGVGTLNAVAPSLTLMADMQYNIGGAWYTFPCSAASVAVPGANLPIVCSQLPTSSCQDLGNGASCDDGNACTSESCQGQSCVSTPVPAGRPCANGNVCNGAGACVAPTVGTDPMTGQPVPVGPPRAPQVATPTGVAGLPPSFGSQCSQMTNQLQLIAGLSPSDPAQLTYSSTHTLGCGFEICTDTRDDDANPQAVFERNPVTPPLSGLENNTSGTPGCAAIPNDGACPYETVQPATSCVPGSTDPAVNPCPARGEVCALACAETDCSDATGRYFCARRSNCSGVSLPAEGPETCTDIRECSDPGNVATTPAANDVADPAFVAPRTDPTAPDQTQTPPPQGHPGAYEIGNACQVAIGDLATVKHGTPDAEAKLHQSRQLTHMGPLGTSQGEGNWRIDFGPGLLKHLTFNPLPYGTANPQLVVRGDWHATATLFGRDFPLVSLQGEVSASFCGLRKYSRFQIMGQDYKLWRDLLRGQHDEPDVLPQDDCWRPATNINLPPGLGEQVERIRNFVSLANEVKKTLEDAMAVRRDFIENTYVQDPSGRIRWDRQAWSKLRTPSIDFLINTFKKLSRTVPGEAGLRERMDDLLAAASSVSFEVLEATDSLPDDAPRQGVTYRRQRLLDDLNRAGYQLELAYTAMQAWMTRYEAKINEFLDAPRQLFPEALRTKKSGIIEITRLDHQFLWTLPPINFAVGPVPVTAGMEISANAGLKGGLNWSVKADRDPRNMADVEEPHARGGLSIEPLVNADVSAYVGAGFESSIGGASVGISGRLRLIGFRTEFTGEMGVERSLQPDQRSISLDYEAYGQSPAFHMGLDFYQWQPMYAFVATGHLDLLSGQLDAYARVRVWRFGKTFRKRVAGFDGKQYSINWGQVRASRTFGPTVTLPSPFSYRAEVKFPKLPPLPAVIDNLTGYFEAPDPNNPGQMIQLGARWGLNAPTAQTGSGQRLGFDACLPSPACGPGLVQSNGVCCPPTMEGRAGQCVCPAPTVLHGNTCISCDTRGSIIGDSRRHYTPVAVAGDHCVSYCSEIPTPCGGGGFVPQNGVCTQVSGVCIE